MIRYPRKNLAKEEALACVQAIDKLAILEEFQELGFESLDSGEYEGNAKGWLESNVDALNLLLGGGAPKGRIIEIFGAEGVGKTTIAVLFAMAAQRAGGLAVMIDVEQAASPERFRNVGLNTKELMYKKSSLNEIMTVEKVYSYLERIMRTFYEKYPTVPLVIIWDSIAATTTQKELDGEVGDAVMAEHARLHSQGLRKINQYISATNSILFLINQTRDKIGTFSGGGTPQTTFGGRAIKFYSSIRLSVKTVFGGDYVENGSIVGNTLSVETVKNKVARPKKKVELALFWDKRGMENESSLLSILLELNVFVKKGAYTQGTLPSGKALSFYAKDWPTIYKENIDEVKSLVRSLYGK